MKTPDLFPETKRPRSPRRVMMHVYEVADTSDEPQSRETCKMRCRRCKAVTGWKHFDTITEARRGIPCETCNKAKE